MTDPKLQTVELDEPIKRGEMLIEQVTLRQPNGGEMRGLSMMDIVQMKTEALFVLVPRISDPILMASELKQMNPADLMQIATVIAQYYVPKKMQSDIGMMTQS